MHRGKEIIYTAHCVLNQNSVIRDWERAIGAFNDIIRVILDNNISIIQLPCPEFSFLGEARPPMTKEEYNTKEYRSACSDISKKVVEQMKEYINNNYKIIGLVGITGSPSCDILGERGIFMEELQQLMTNEDIRLEVFEIPGDYVEGEHEKVIDEFRVFINKNRNIG
ncbi:hypothetical protein DUF523 [Gottschalkia acidurici 9a]|uniref:Uncharacterized protein n=1 Tax=Gottschalkia acidurici (strain ATCC 7906 / DSM 604 / BCRC 14475 / CIP 104303 / KCTC 5404 / NCIMB 10678 / 9a) TaxID=1128398 RepID=K0AYK5_GOTA9|nr:CD3072 family TudS-related putative desulfidase [Gottschalkia acidurici]AFS77820.1 hypothetical protein DUF523 [Gottschalkia acidurici 9a]